MAFVAIGLLDRISGGVLTPAFASRELPLELLSGLPAVSHFLNLLNMTPPGLQKVWRFGIKTS